MLLEEKISNCEFYPAVDQGTIINNWPYKVYPLINFLINSKACSTRQRPYLALLEGLVARLIECENPLMCSVDIVN